jgi:hypothetical protein
MSLILNFLTGISIIAGNPQMLPQIRIYDVEAESCLNIAAITCPNNLRLILTYADLGYVRSNGRIVHQCRVKSLNRQLRM